jgi:hypothetical protein
MYLMYTLDADGKRVYTLKVRGGRERAPSVAKCGGRPTAEPN